MATAEEKFGTEGGVDEGDSGNKEMNSGLQGLWNHGNNVSVAITDGEVLRNNKAESIEVLSDETILTRWCGHETILCLRNDGIKLLEVHDGARKSMSNRFIWKRDALSKSKNGLIGRWTLEDNGTAFQSFVIDDNHMVYRAKQIDASRVINNTTILSNWFNHDMLLILIDNDTILEIYGPSNNISTWNWNKKLKK